MHGDRSCSGVVLAVMLIAAGPGVAATLTVAPDGSGAFTTIQGAITAASVGDTILLGPGRYLDSFEWAFNGGAWTNTVHAAVTVDSLVIMGVDRDLVVIGPEVPDFWNFGPKGIVVEPSVSILWLQDVTLENLYDGLYTASGGAVRNCRAQGCYFGVTSFSESVLEIIGCEFQVADSGVASWWPASGLLIMNCSFSGYSGVSLVATLGARIDDCDFRGLWGGIHCEGGTTALIENCTMTEIGRVNVDMFDSTVDLRNNVIGRSEWGIMIQGASHVTGSGNVIGGGSYAALLFAWRSEISLSGSHILRSPGEDYVRTWFYDVPDTTMLDLRNNYWGTTDVDSISAAIQDGRDDPDIHAIVEFLPLADGPLPTEKKSLGDLKSLFLGR